MAPCVPRGDSCGFVDGKNAAVGALGQNEHLIPAYRGGAVISNNLFIKMNVGCSGGFFQCWQ